MEDFFKNTGNLVKAPRIRMKIFYAVLIPSGIGTQSVSSLKVASSLSSVVLEYSKLISASFLKESRYATWLTSQTPDMPMDARIVIAMISSRTKYSHPKGAYTKYAIALTA